MFRDVGYLLLLAAIPALVLLHLSIAPYTKVEESFHIQAIHDIETYGIPSRNIPSVLKAAYDHFEFPGAVPRTFAGAVALSGLSSPIISFKQNIDRQFLARTILGLFNASSLLYFASALRRAAGGTAAAWFLLFQASQFHIIYYASRTLSNMFAFGMTTIALAALLPTPGSSSTYRKRSRLALYLITIAGIVFRAELALFLATHTIFLFATGRIGIQREIIPAGILGLLLGLFITIPLDSFFWQQFPLWPEFAAFKFNVLAGQSSAWGTHSWHYYFSNALPRLLLNPLTYIIAIPLSLLQPATRRISASLLIPSLTYIFIYSAQPHKEWRFIVYAIPPLTASAALGAAYIWTHKSKSIIYRFLSLCLIASTLASFWISSFLLLPASAANYPGAAALNTLHNHVLSVAPRDTPLSISVHLGNLACQTGVTRFLQLPSNIDQDTLPTSHNNEPQITWTYDKTPTDSDSQSQSFLTRFDYLLLEPSEAELLLTLSGKTTEFAQFHTYAWETVDSISGFAGIKLVEPEKEASGEFEEGVLRSFLGSKADGVVGLWRKRRDFARGLLGGWWVEGRMEERIRVLRRVG
ncbi:Alg9-like mannosyltransferase family-domain-containing protein [Aspergillus karnatakaensis]|uniref:dolichyl-P-Man:Man(7)GlcNAc(2)-PP-dolichol alpha-1,6-mannosyltransferase n=1 Tax=Aspergillus karnatakaensis TaxID=1810916 RepID=UPI003CCDACCF